MVGFGMLFLPLISLAERWRYDRKHFEPKGKGRILEECGLVALVLFLIDFFVINRLEFSPNRRAVFRQLLDREVLSFLIGQAEVVLA